MRKTKYVEFTIEQAEVMVKVINEAISRRRKFMERFPSVDVSEEITKFLYDSLELIEDAVLLNLDVVIEFERKPLYIAALHLISSIAADMSEFLEDESIYNQCIFKIIHATRGE